MRLATLVAALAALTACDDLFNYNKEAGTEVPLGDDYCSIQALFEAECFICHSASAATAGLDLETDLHAEVVDQPSTGGGTYVVPGDSAGSELYLRVSGAAPFDSQGIMPPGSGLSADAAQVVADWIDNGATTDCGQDTAAN